MISGMLWFDNDKKSTFSNKIDRAAQYYRKKYGHTPDICFVHPQMMTAEQKNLPDTKLEVKSSPSILHHYFWIGTKQPNEDN